jgi:hypothetical protein
VGGIYGPVSKLKHNPNKILRPILLGEVVQKNQKIVFFILFLAICGPQNGPKMLHKGSQMGKMYGPMFKLKNKPLTKSLGPLF